MLCVLVPALNELFVNSCFLVLWKLILKIFDLFSSIFSLGLFWTSGVQLIGPSELSFFCFNFISLWLSVLFSKISSICLPILLLNFSSLYLNFEKNRSFCEFYFSIFLFFFFLYILLIRLLCFFWKNSICLIFASFKLLFKFYC